MTSLTELKAITPTANAKAVVQAKGADLNALILMAQQHVIELQAIMKQIVALHPTGGGDAANYTALGNILNELL